MGNIDSMIKDIEESNIIQKYEERVKIIKNININDALQSFFKKNYIKELKKSKDLFNDNQRVYTEKIDNMKESKVFTKKQLYQLHNKIKKNFDNYSLEDDFTYGTKMFFIVNKFLESLVNIKIFANILKFHDKKYTIKNFRKPGRYYFLLFYIYINSCVFICPALHEDENNDTLVANEFAEKIDFMGVKDDNIVQVIEDPNDNYKSYFKVNDNIIGGIDFTILTEDVDLCMLYKNKIIDYLLKTSKHNNINDFSIELHKDGVHIKKDNYYAKIFLDLNSYVNHLNNLYKQIKSTYRPNDTSEISQLSVSF